MINRLGKFLVIVNLAVSLTVLAFAGAVYFQQLDWGWQDPRSDYTGEYRLPSEIDQRYAALTAAQDAVAIVLLPLQKAEESLTEARPRLYQNHLWYREQLARLVNDPKLTEVKDFKYEQGTPRLDAPNIGKPVLDQPVPGLDKCYVKYAEEFRDLQKSVSAAVNEVSELIDKEEKPLTFKLNGRDEAGKRLQPGLYELVDSSYQEQVRTKFEIEYLRPRWTEIMRQLGHFEERRHYLEDNLARLKKARTEKN